MSNIKTDIISESQHINLKDNINKAMLSMCSDLKIKNATLISHAIVPFKLESGWDTNNGCLLSYVYTM